MSAWFGRAGGGDALPEGKPAVWLVTDASFSEAQARVVGAGCEEEGVPLAWDVADGAADALARKACHRSQLEVGIGIDSRRNGAISMITVTEAPYVERTADTGAHLRWLGQTAARLSKGEPIYEDCAARAETRGGTDEKNEKSGAPERTAAANAASAPTQPLATERVTGETGGDGEVDAVVRAVMRVLRGLQEGGGGGHGEG